MTTHLFSVDGDHTGSEFHANCEVMHGLEALVGELEQQTGLANAYKRRGRVAVIAN